MVFISLSTGTEADCTSVFNTVVLPKHKMKTCGGMMLASCTYNRPAGVWDITQENILNFFETSG